MKKIQLLIATLTLMAISQLSFGQSQSQRFKMEGSNPETIAINQTFTEDAEIFPFEKNVNKVFGLAVSAEITLEDETSDIKLILIDKNFTEHLIYEANYLLAPLGKSSIEEICEETSVLNDIKIHSVKIVVLNATVELKNLTYTRAIRQGVNFEELKKEKKQAQNEEKITKINKSLQEKGMHWIAGPTEVSELTYDEKKQLYGQSTFPAGFEYYAGGVISTATGEIQLKSATASSPFVEDWDWRNRHGKNWISPVTNQGSCGSCWAFASTGATEAMVNVFFNQILNLNLSEQDVLSCSGGGTCSGGYPSTALNYIAKTGIVDEGAFPYNGTDQPCANKGTSPADKIKIGGKVDFGTSAYPKTEDDLKRMLIQMGPVSGGLYDWSHAMVLVGYKIVKEGDKFYYRDLNLARSWKTVAAGDPLIGKTVWIFKNSWGPYFGDAGYVYVETPITNMGWTHALQTPVTSAVKNYQVICEDKDGDGYYWWGLGQKPVTCNCPDTPDGNDADPTLGPLDQYGNYTVLTGIPTANFSADKTSVIQGGTVNFTDLSTNNPISWTWTFAGGNPSTSTVQNPAITYSNSGIYAVTLTVTNTKGSDTKTVNAYIQANEPAVVPIANFSASKAVISEGETVNFTDLSTNNPTSWAWTFIGGTPSTSTEKNPAVVYSSAGTYNVTLTVMNATGSASKSAENFIQVIEPVAVPVAEFAATKTSLKVGENVQFNDLSTNSPTRWEWSFPGGTPETSTEQKPIITYKIAGQYDVSLIVSKDGYSPSEKIKQKYIVTVENTPASYCVPVAISSASDYIQKVTIGTVLNNPTAGVGYSISNIAVSMIPGKSYSVSLVPNLSTTRNYWKLWIDFNGDGDFNDSGETLVSVSNKKGTLKTTIIIPQNATGTARMRIAMRTGTAPAPCDDNYRGEVEDYPISFEPAPMMATPAITYELKEVKDGLKYYPNPINQLLNVQLESIQPGDFYTIYNINGGKVVSDNITSTHTTIDFGNYSPGIYLLSVVNGDCVFNERIIRK